jgi:hypothetical protein
MNLCIVYMGIQFVGFFGTAMYFVRISYYFSLFPVIVLPWMFTKLRDRGGDLICMVACCCYFAFFYLTEPGSFAGYQALTLSGFLKILSNTVKGLI